MLFSDLVFLYLFLPIALLLYYAWSHPLYQNLVLLIVSIVFYTYGEPMFIAGMLGLGAIHFMLSHGMVRYRSQARLLLWSGVLIDVGLLFGFKYFSWLSGIWTQEALSSVWSPLGLSFVTFKMLSYLLDVYYEKVDPCRSLLNFLNYTLLFQNVLAGPIVRYADIEEQLERRNLTYAHIGKGLFRLGVGLFKKVWIADVASGIVLQFTDVSSADVSLLGNWYAMLAFAFQIYFDFSGYSDMAIGLGYLFGFTFKENFQYPYISKSTSEFWRRWHISLSTWFNDYVFLPLHLGLRSWGKLGLVLSIILTFGLSGLWHGPSINYVLWGLFFGITISIETLFLNRLFLRIPAIFQHIYFIICILFSMSLFYFTDIHKWLNFIELSLYFRPVSLWNEYLFWSFQEHIVWLFLCFVLSLPMYLWIEQRLMKERVYWGAQCVVGVFFLLFCTSGILNQSYQVFLYLKF